MNEYKTKEDILDDCMRVELGPGEFVYTEDALQAMQLYADQQTASKDREITDLKSELESETDRLNSIIHEELTSNDEYKDMIDEKDAEIDELKNENEGFRMENKELKKEVERLKKPYCGKCGAICTACDL